MTHPEAMPTSEAVSLTELVRYQPDSIVSRTIAKNGGGNLTVFAFDAGQALSEHSAPFDALVQVVDGEAELVIGGKTVVAPTGSLTLMPANVPHAVHARQRFSMMLIMLRDPR